MILDLKGILPSLLRVSWLVRKDSSLELGPVPQIGEIQSKEIEMLFRITIMDSV